MEVLLVNTYDIGGAATATSRIRAGLEKVGVQSQVLVQIKRGDDPKVIGPTTKPAQVVSEARALIDPLPLKLHGGSDTNFSLNWLPERTLRRIDSIDPDVVHLNWVAGGFLTPRTISNIDRPIVWRLPDMWAFTGGCHYSQGCDRYGDSCGDCPQLDSRWSRDLSRWTWKRKARAWRDLEMTVVTPSTWLADRALESSLFGDYPVEVIPNPLDTNRFEPRRAETGRELFDLPMEKDLVLYGAPNALDDPRKGFDLLRAGLSKIAEGATDTDIELVVFGASAPEDPPDFGVPTHYVGYLGDEPSLVLLYSAADVMVVPSRYEGFGQTASEALACGTPVVAFDATGPSDIVEHKVNGYLAEAYDPRELGKGITWVLEDRDRRARLASNARYKAVEEYHDVTVADRYRTVYDRLIGST